MHALEKLELAARDLLPAPVYRYFSQGASDGITTAEAVQAWRRFRFLPRVLTDVSEVSVATSLLGTPVRTPIAIAPTSLQRHAHPLGEIEMATGAAAAGALLCVSSNAGRPFADIAEAAGPWWVQAYVLEDRDITAAMLDRAVAAGCSAVVLTADTPVVGSKDSGSPSVWEMTPSEYLHANEQAEGLTRRDVEKARDLTPADITWLADRTSVPVVVKGVLRADDATRVVDAGADAVWVSNHGGRQLDRSISTAQALGPVVAAVGQRTEVYVDGGLRDGRDAMAALALGARAVFLGRPPLWALSTGGADAVRRLMAAVTVDLVEAMALAGCRSLAELQPDLLAASRDDEFGV